MIKSICQKCIQEGTLSGWSAADERAWQDNKIYCPQLYQPANQWDYIWAPGPPPEYCGYVLEHVVLGQKE